MKFIASIIFLILFVCSCTNEQDAKTTVTTTTTDSLSAKVSAPNTTKPTPKKSSKYAALSPSTFSGKISKHQGTAFLNLVSPKQTNLKATTNDFVVRRDTLYEVQYLPFKDQELYLHTIAIEQIKEKEVLTNWCFSILKNGSTLVEDQVISADLFSSLRLEKMTLGDTELVFVGTRKDGTTETFRMPYDGKKI
ncbi:MAG: Unknown protein [uncultured Aureispira sp.]|uniref:Uncharacterized protein n=1 Tax=uncultured Aureispira sp. TaxID=1331704 RepID=A0A6S6TBU5_9BACT|nr:MAG: Unknown protein [uncultured Aureispira sp.]